MKPIRTRRDPQTMLGGKPYTPSTHTDLRKTFARVSSEQARAAASKASNGKAEHAAATASVMPIRKVKP